MTRASGEPRRAVEPSAQQPGEPPEDWFRRTFGAMPPPVPDDEPSASSTSTRSAAMSALDRTIPASYLWARLGAAELRQRVPRPAIAWAENAWKHDRVCLMGASRAGKTSLAVAMLRRRASERHVAGVFLHAYRLGVARILHPAGHGEPELVAVAMRAPVVLIDDLGGERDHATSAIPDILVERHAEGRATWVTTGMTREQLVARYGQGIVARVFERATVIRVGGGAERAGEKNRHEL